MRLRPLPMRRRVRRQTEGVAGEHFTGAQSVVAALSNAKEQEVAYSTAPPRRTGRSGSLAPTTWEHVISLAGERCRGPHPTTPEEAATRAHTTPVALSPRSTPGYIPGPEEMAGPLEQEKTCMFPC